MTLKEFFESEEKLALHIPTEEDDLKIRTAFNNAGYKRNFYKGWLDFTFWDIMQSNTCYTNNWSSINKLYASEEDYKVISMGDIDFD